MSQKITEEEGIHKDWYKQAREMSTEGLPEFIRHLTQDYDHDYDTICHAIAAAGLAAMRALDSSPVGGITRFQAGTIMWEVIRGWGASGQNDSPFRMLDYNDALYPQYEYKFQSVSPEIWNWIQQKAKYNLAEYADDAHPDVIEHWKHIIAGDLPFGLKVVSDE